MQMAKRKTGAQPRELRRRVILPARLRLGAQWSDACILNVSSRGMLIQTGQPAQQGMTVELRRDRHVIMGRIMWQAGGRIGLHCEERVPVEEILSLGAGKTLQLVAADGARIERRRVPRGRVSEARHRGRVLQFAGVLTIALVLSISGVVWVRATLARPLSAAGAALTP
jgi:hypothetical protein